MIQQHKKILENKTAVTAAYRGGGATAVQLKNNREYSVVQRKLAEGTTTTQLASFMPVQRKTNHTGLPDILKSGIESLSGHSMDDVKVHYNSDKPAQLQAHAYAQGTDIHIASGQEKHLPHEAWHVVQQKQGRVKPTLQMKGKVNVNDDEGLEKEADVMGAKALQLKDNRSKTISKEKKITKSNRQVKQLFLLNKISLNYNFQKKQPIQLVVGKNKRRTSKRITAQNSKKTEINDINIVNKKRRRSPPSRLHYGKGLGYQDSITVKGPLATKYGNKLKASKTKGSLPWVDFSTQLLGGIKFVIEYTGTRAGDYKKAEDKLKRKHNPKIEVWHHVADYNKATNKGTLELLPYELHNAIKHRGGVEQAVASGMYPYYG